MWDPATSTFVAIKKAVQQNFPYLQNTGEAPEAIQFSERDDEEYSDVLKRALRNEVASYRNQMQELQQELEKQMLVNERLQNRLDEFESQNPSGNLDLTALRQQNHTLQQKVRELEVVNDRLRSELHVRPKEETEESSQSIVDQMAAVDMLSVVYHPGVGHINLSPDHILEYLEDPQAYAAHQVSLNKEQYLAWLEHHRQSRCQVCDDQIAVIADPSIFDAERDVYCDRHKP